MQTLGWLSRLLAVGCVAGVIALLAGVGLTPAVAQSSGAVTIADFSFSAATVTIEAGGSVTWTNTGAVPHAVTGDGAEFDTGLIDAGESATVTFSTPGTYAYHCSVHPDMVATVEVLAADDGGGNGDGGEEEPVGELPNTGAGIDNPSYPYLAAILAGLAVILMGTTLVIRRKA